MTLDAENASELFRREPERFLHVGDSEVAYRRVGEGPDVLFVHGWPVSSATFRVLLPHLADHVTCHLIDLPGAGASRFTAGSTLTLQNHIDSVRRVVDLLGLDDVAVVGHDSGGLVARHAMAGDPRLRAMGLIDTELATHNGWKFTTFVASRHLPGFGRALGWAAGKPRVRRSRLIFGDAFHDRSRLDGEFAEFFLVPLHDSPTHLSAATRLLKSYDPALVHQLGSIHSRIDVPVVLVCGEHDRFFPVKRAATMAREFPAARLEVIPQAGLFAHEENPQVVAHALLPTIGT